MSIMTPIRDCAQPSLKNEAPKPHVTCRLSLHIDLDGTAICADGSAVKGTFYAIRGLACDHSASLQCFSLRKQDGTTYHVSRNEHGAECDCSRFMFRRDGLDGCQHVRALVSLGLLDLAPHAMPTGDDSPEADEPDWDSMANESHAMDCLERGLIPSDVADYIARTTLVGHEP